MGRFAESLVTLGEFKMPHRFDFIDDMLWRYHYDIENNLYLCQQKKQATELNSSKPEIKRTPTLTAKNKT